MAEFAPVLPAKLYSAIDTPNQNALRFVHAPQVVGCKALASWLENQPRARVILDCFSYELCGEVPDVAKLKLAIGQLYRQKLIIISPDIIKDHKHTLEMLYKHGQYLGAHGKVMIVPHGNGLLEWINHAEIMIEAADRANMRAPRDFMVGIPRYVDDFYPTGERFARGIAAGFLCAYYPKVRVHLLGTSKGLYEAVIVARNSPNVVSMDSTTPFVWAMNHGIYRDLHDKDEMPDDWWDMELLGHDDTLDPTATTITPSAVATAKINIAIWKQALANA